MTFLLLAGRRPDAGASIRITVLDRAMSAFGPLMSDEFLRHAVTRTTQ